MRFIHPSQLIWGALIAVPLILYLFRRKPRKVPVSTLLFFKALAREHQESAWLRRLKRLLSLLLTLLAILCAVGVLARLVVAPSSESLMAVVIVVDRSASMAAQDQNGQTRLEAALTRTREWLAGLSAGASVIVMAFDRQPEILLPSSYDRREVERALSSIRVRPIEGRPDRALRLARRMAALETPSSVWLATDGPTPSLRSEDPGPDGEDERARDQISLQHIDVRLPAAVNAGITALKIRPLPLERGRFDAFVQVHAAAPEPLEAKLEVRVDGALMALRSMTIEPGGRERVLIPVGAGEGKELSLQVKVEDDILPLDNEVHLRIPELQPIRVLWVTEAPDPFTRLALTTLGRDHDIEVYQCEPSSWPPTDAVDVVMLDGWLPDEWPTDLPIILISPPRSCGPVQAVPIGDGGLPVESLRTTDLRHPLLYGVASDRLSLAQTTVMEANGSLDPLWVGPSGPILLAGEVRGQRLVVMGFAAEQSEHLPLTASYPLLIGNALYWASQGAFEEQVGQNYRTGDLIRLGGKNITWTVPSPKGAKKASLPLSSHWTELDRIGLWETDTEERGSASLLSARETRLNTLEKPDDSDQANARAVRASILRGDLSSLLLWGVMLLLVVESWLFHRHGVY